MKKGTAGGVFLGVICFLASWAWAEATGAKAIFYSGEGPTVMVTPSESPTLPKVETKTEPKKEKYMGIAYWVELIGKEGQKQRVTTERTFRSGERIRLHLVSNWDGYLYLINIGSTGRSHLLFPHPAIAGGNNFVKANTPYEIPYSAYIRFDENRGEEILLVMLSPTPMAGLISSPDPRTQALTTEEADRLTKVAQQRGAKDLILEVDTASPQPGSYAVAPLSVLEKGGQMISLQIKLRHE